MGRIKVFQVSPTDWIAARSAWQARTYYKDLVDREPFAEAPELTDQQMVANVFGLWEPADISGKTWAQALAEMLADPRARFPCLFACKE